MRPQIVAGDAAKHVAQNVAVSRALLTDFVVFLGASNSADNKSQITSARLRRGRLDLAHPMREHNRGKSAVNRCARQRLRFAPYTQLARLRELVSRGSKTCGSQFGKERRDRCRSRRQRTVTSLRAPGEEQVPVRSVGLQRRLGAATTQEVINALLIVRRKIGKVELLRFDAIKHGECSIDDRIETSRTIVARHRVEHGISI